jgi:hypothetical protein
VAEQNFNQTAVREALSQPAAPDQVPEDALADQDAEERRLGREPLPPPEASTKVPEEILVERDQDARADDALLWTDDDDLA